jgi:glutathione S-transferase
MIKLHYFPGNASMVPHILLEELAVPYEQVLVDRTAGAHKRPDYLRLNPNGLIPVLTEGDLVLYETAAIVLHLADRHSDAALIPPLGSDERSLFYKWLVWLTNTLQTALIAYFYPERWVDPGNADGAAQVKSQAERKIAGLLDQLDAELARQGGPWFAGADYTALDPYVFILCRWTRNFANEAPARSRTHLGPYLQKMLGRPAVQRVLANEGLTPPFV